PPVNRLEAQHDLRNPASGRVMEKSGMKKEGILRQRIRNKGEYVDVALFAILRSDLENQPL
ncbi:MAG: GNAT family protein, partial [Clostridia bacterium]